jgi:hypothetical protein
MKLMDSVEGLLIILPRYRVLCAEGGLVNLYRWRTTSDTAQHQSAEPEGVCRTKYTTDIVDTSDVVKHHDQGQLRGFLESFYGETMHLQYTQFVHLAFAYIVLSLCKFTDLPAISARYAQNNIVLPTLWITCA